MVVLLLSVSTACGGCDDPTEERLAPRESRLFIMMDLDPAMDFQPLWLASFNGEEPKGVSAELWADGALLSTSAPASINNCRDRLTLVLIEPIGGGGGVCVAFDFQPTYGATYELIVESPDRPTLMAETTVPGDFRVVSGVVEGDPPGTERLDLTWTRSDPSHGYVVFVIDRSHSRGAVHSGVTGLPYGSPGWVLATTDTTISTHRPPDEVWDGNEGDWAVAVYAVDEALFEFMHSGSNEALFPVPPASNVVDGYGFFGSWVRKYVPVDSLPAP